jgi:tRNA (Thr-GGU) A37 N-methylase
MILLPPGQRLPVPADGQKPLHVITRSGRRDELSADLDGCVVKLKEVAGRADPDDLGSLVAVPAANEQTVVVQTSYGFAPIGWVQSALRVLDDAPNQREGAPQAWISFDEQVAEGARDLRPGDEIVVLTWLHLSPRDELSTHPEDDMSRPLTGVFSTCSPNRPNPIGLHRARIVARDGYGLKSTLWRQSTGRRW